MRGASRDINLLFATNTLSISRQISNYDSSVRVSLMGEIQKCITGSTQLKKITEGDEEGGQDGSGSTLAFAPEGDIGHGYTESSHDSHCCAHRQERHLVTICTATITEKRNCAIKFCFAFAEGDKNKNKNKIKIKRRKSGDLLANFFERKGSVILSSKRTDPGQDHLSQRRVDVVGEHLVQVPIHVFPDISLIQARTTTTHEPSIPRERLRVSLLSCGDTNLARLWRVNPDNNNSRSENIDLHNLSGRGIHAPETDRHDRNCECTQRNPVSTTKAQGLLSLILIPRRLCLLLFLLFLSPDFVILLLLFGDGIQIGGSRRRRMHR